MTALTDLTGSVFGRLTVAERAENDARSRAQWLCLCQCGQTKVVPSDRLTGGKTQSCGCLRREMGIARALANRVETPGYCAAHDRHRRTLGKASAQTCIRCGGPAQQWAYDHSDPDEMYGTIRGCVVAYSLDPAHYLPMCVSDHIAFDRPAGQAVTGT